MNTLVKEYIFLLGLCLYSLQRVLVILMLILLCLKNNSESAIYRDWYQRDLGIDANIRDWLWWGPAHSPQ